MLEQLATAYAHRPSTESGLGMLRLIGVQIVQNLPAILAALRTESVPDGLPESRAMTAPTPAQPPDYAEFGRRVLDACRDELGDLEGGWLQDQAIECGLLHEVPVTEPCGEVCNCAEYGEFPTKCLRQVQGTKP